MNTYSLGFVKIFLLCFILQTLAQSAAQTILKRNNRNDYATFTTLQTGLPLSDDDNSLKAGERGPTLLEDFIFREKMQHFDHERIPERVVHARGSSAFGTFRANGNGATFTSAKFLKSGVVTPVFTRFSVVLGSNGCPDTTRDVRGFAVRFYTEEGNYDLVGNNIPIFFIQDAHKFPDLIHAGKPEPHNERPQGGTAHDNAWDFFSLTPESTAMTLWALSDRAIPRSYRTMEGFGVHTFVMVNENNNASFVKFHWKPKQGLKSLTWDEAQKIAGKNIDFHREDLWMAIERGDYPEWDLGVQVVPINNNNVGFDLNDPTKLIPEESVPVVIIGTMALDRNPVNYFAQSEQVSYCVANVVPGIDFSDDPLLHGRLYSYLDTQLNRHSSPNYHNIPINSPLKVPHNNERDGFMQTNVFVGNANYYPNSVGGNYPRPTPTGYKSYPLPVSGVRTRNRSSTFNDYYSQAQLFWNSLSAPEKQHLIDAGRFELGKVKSIDIRRRMINRFNNVDNKLAVLVANAIGVEPPAPINNGNHGQNSSALSMANYPKGTIAATSVAVLAGPGANDDQVCAVYRALSDAHVYVDIVAPVLGYTVKGCGVAANKTFITTSPVLYDGVYIPGGPQFIAMLLNFSYNADPLEFGRETYKHAKPIAASTDAMRFLQAADVPYSTSSPVSELKGVVTQTTSGDINQLITEFRNALLTARFWSRQHFEV